MKIAVIGSGISSLTCAYLLSPHHEVHLFEANDYLGGHTNTIAVNAKSGTYAVDTGFIVFNEKNYPGFTMLVSLCGVESQDSSMSFSVKSEKNGLEYNGGDLNQLFAQRKNIFNLKFLKMLSEILRFNKESVRDYDTEGDGISIGDYLTAKKYSSYFAEHYVLAMGAAIWSSSSKQMLDFPFDYFVIFLRNHGMLTINDRPTWKTIRGGSKTYIPKLIKGLEGRVHLNSAVRAIKHTRLGVALHSSSGLLGEFDQVIIGTHSDQALKMLETPSPLEVEILGAIKYQLNETTLHTDESVLPSKKKTWASWNYFLPAEASSKVSISYNMNILQGIKSPESFIVSLNSDHYIDPTKVINKFTYHHPVFDAHAVVAQKGWTKISGVDRIHYCGAYWGHGFHEDGVQSAFRVCKSIGVEI